MLPEKYYENARTSVAGAADCRSHYIPYEEKSNSEFSGPPLKLSLNGEWAFELFCGIESIPEEYIAPDSSLTGCSRITVPSFWQTEGFGNSTDFSSKTDTCVLPIPFDPPRVPSDMTVGVYRRYIKLGAPDNRKKYLVFEGVSSAFYLYVNGNPAGFSSAGHSLCEFEIARFLNEGKNLIAVIVLPYSCAGYFDSPEMRYLSGIFRPVYLLSRLPGHIRDMVITAKVADDLRTAEITANIETECPEKISASLNAPDGTRIDRVMFDEDGQAKFTVTSPKLWNYEDTVLYSVTAEFCGEFITRPAGIRRITVDSNGLKLNGREIILNGVKYNPFSSDRGIMTKSAMKSDIFRMKQNGINAVALCGASPDPELLSLCDRYGMLAVICADIDNTAFEACSSDICTDNPEYYPLIEQRLTRQAVALRDHPSVIGWCFDGFDDSGKNIAGAIRLIKSLDPDRLTFCDCSDRRHPDRMRTKLCDISYAANPDGEWLERLVSYPYDNRPMIIWNYSHRTCPLGEGFAGYRRAIDSSARIIGGFTDEWCDRILKLPDGNKLCFSQKGLVDSERRMYSSLTELKSAFLPCKIDEIDAAAGDFYITNCFDFSYLSKLECSFEITRYGKTVKTGLVGAFPLAPHKCIRFHADYELPDDGECYIRFIFRRLGDCEWMEDGEEQGSIQLPLPCKPAEPAVYQTVLCPKICEKNGEIIISGDRFEYIFSKISGGFSQLYSVSDGAKYALLKQPVTFCAKLLRDTRTLRLTARSVECSLDDSVAVIRSENYFMTNGRTEKIHIVSIWCVSGDGIITLDSSVDCSPELPHLVNFGVKFPVKDELCHIKYYGLGPYDNTPGRALGCHHGFFEASTESLCGTGRSKLRRGCRSVTYWSTENENADGLCVYNAGGLVLFATQQGLFACNPAAGDTENQKQFDFSLIISPLGGNSDRLSQMRAIPAYMNGENL